VNVDSTEVSVDELLRRADVAMYRAKHLGRDQICVFEPGLDAARTRRVEISAALAHALATGALRLVYQPIFNARTGRIAVAEALLRWPQAPDRVQPQEFVAIAEETGLIDELGLWTLRQACRDATAWPNVKVAVNVSPAQFRNSDFASVVAGVLEEAGLPANRLEIEVTENFVIAQPEQAGAVIEALRRLGVVLALDDFGTGFSSIGHLRRFGFDKVKIDRALVTRIDTDRQAQELVQATVHIARALGLTVTAEGVETEAEAVLMRAAGCHELQGYFLARPETARALSDRLPAAGLVARSA
jgi:EAL domain-containing protein (putative c-di-GMP-specific phosphodiesterase class I)